MKMYTYLQTNTRVINISILDSRLNPNLSRVLLFIHAISRCDTTSKPNGKATAVGKCSELKEAIV